VTPGPPSGARPPFVAAGRPPNRRGPARYIALFGVVAAVLLLWVVVLTNFAQVGASPSTSGPPIPPPSTHSRSLLSTSTAIFGPETQNASVIQFSLPVNITAAWVEGSVNVTCTASGNCLGNVGIFTISGWHAYLMSGSENPIWCFKRTGHTACDSEQNTPIASSNLVTYAGQTLVLCLWGDSPRDVQQYAASVNLVWVAP
jgi:hypothetical protein